MLIRIEDSSDEQLDHWQSCTWMHSNSWEAMRMSSHIDQTRAQEWCFWICRNMWVNWPPYYQIDRNPPSIPARWTLHGIMVGQDFRTTARTSGAAQSTRYVQLIRMLTASSPIKILVSAVIGIRIFFWFCATLSTLCPIVHEMKCSDLPTINDACLRIKLMSFRNM